MSTAKGPRMWLVVCVGIGWMDAYLLVDALAKQARALLLRGVEPRALLLERRPQVLGLVADPRGQDVVDVVELGPEGLGLSRDALGELGVRRIELRCERTNAIGQTSAQIVRPLVDDTVDPFRLHIQPCAQARHLYPYPILNLLELHRY